MIPQFGLVAEQVEKVDPELVVRDDTGKPYSVRYEAVNAMLLNELETQSSEIADLKAAVTNLKAALQEQGAQLQNVSAQLTADRSPGRIATNE